MALTRPLRIMPAMPNRWKPNVTVAALIEHDTLPPNPNPRKIGGTDNGAQPANADTGGGG